ncbi:hypothetical protein EDC94DRAFT_620646 [Helicostylum pulchrum]|nr:hypothetical protein EDC94DRAFT_620646 [Helicostylum pulchrum]
MHGHPPPPPPQQQQPFFATNNNNFRNPNMRNYRPDMEFMDNANPYDSPRGGIRTQQRRQRSKSMESQWLPAHELIDSHQYQQRVPPQPHNFAYDPTDHTNNYQHVPRARSRKSSTHSAKSNLSDGAAIRNARDLQNEYHSAAEEEEDCLLDANNNPEKEMNRENKRNSDGEQRQFQNEEHRSHNRYRRRQQPPPPPPPPNMHPSMMYPNFGPPPPHMSHMGMDNRDRIKMRPPPPYGYNNNGPSGNEYYPYIPQRVSPRMMAAFTEEQQWNGPHRSQWPNQKMYGIPPPPPPPQGVPENLNGNNGTGNVPNAGNGPHHLQDPVNENNFARRYPQTNSLQQQQTPQQSQHGYMSMYGDAPHILYI